MSPSTVSRRSGTASAATPADPATSGTPATSDTSADPVAPATVAAGLASGEAPDMVPGARPRPGSGDPVIDAIIGTAALLRERANTELARCGLSLWTFKALRALDTLGPARSVDLSSHLAIAPRTVTAAVDALECEGLVERRPHPTDRRSHLLVLTDAGRHRLTEAREVHLALVARAADVLVGDDRERFLELIGKVAARAEAGLSLDG